MKKINILFVCLLMTLISCDESYDGPLYLVKIQHTGVDFEQVDTMIMGQPRLSNYTLTADDQKNKKIRINNVRNFKILRTINTRFSDSTIACKVRQENIRNSIKCKWYNK